MSLLHLARDVAVALADGLRGRTRRRYEHSIDIKSPPEIVWEMLKARDIVFDGRHPVRVVGQPVPGQPGVERVHIMVGPHRLEMLTRIVDEVPGRAILYQLMPEGTDAALLEGDDDYIGFVLVEASWGTRLDLTRETTPRSWLSRLTVPIGLRSGARRYKRKAEALLEQALSPAAGAGNG